MANTVEKNALIVDIQQEKLIISWKSTGKLLLDNKEFSHRFVSISIDTADTFICKNEPSALAKTISLYKNINRAEDGTIEYEYYDYNEDIDKFEIDFNDILSEDVPNELLFIWIKEEVYIKQDDELILYTQEPYKYGFGVTLNVQTFYELLLNNIKATSKKCCDKIDCADVDMMLFWNGFNLAKTLHEYKQAVTYWKLLHNSNSINSSKCSCSNR